MRGGPSPITMRGPSVDLGIFVQTWVPRAPTGSGTDIYVATAANGGSDSNAGTIGSPKLTLHGADAIATAGSVIHVAPGTYPMGSATLANLTASGTASNRITFWSSTLHGAKIVLGVAPAGNLIVVQLQGNYTDFMGFDIDGTLGTGSNIVNIGLYSESSSHCVVQYNRIHDFFTNSTDYTTVNGGSAGGAGIDIRNYLGQVVSCTVDSNIVFNIGLAGASSSNIHAIYMACPGTYSNNLVYNVVDGIQGWHEFTNANVLNNTVDTSGNAGISIQANYPTDPVANNCNVNSNIVTNSLYGIVETGGGSLSGANNTYLNNTIYNCGTPTQFYNGNTDVNTITTTPSYVNAAAGNFQLQVGSSSLASGSTTAPTTTTNILGQTRGSPPNRGCY